MRTKKIELPNYGVLDITLDKEHLDHLHHLVEKYEPDNAMQQWMLIDDDNRFQKEVLRKVIQQYIEDFGIPHRLRTTHIHELTFQKFSQIILGRENIRHYINMTLYFLLLYGFKIPSCAKEEQESKCMHPDAGDFVLTYNDITGSVRKVNWKLEQQYNEGHMLIFPSDLFHAVYPHYLTDEKRLSVPGDIAINSGALKGINDQGMLLGPCNSQEFLKKDYQKKTI